MIKCLLLKTGTVVVSEMLEVGAEVGEPDCQLINPCEIDGRLVQIKNLS